MEYDEFDAEYRRVLDGAAGLSAEALAAEVDRLRALSVRISDPADRRDADNDIASLASVLTVEHLPTSSPAELEAGRVHSRAIADGGTTGNASLVRRRAWPRSAASRPPPIPPNGPGPSNSTSPWPCWSARSSPTADASSQLPGPDAGAGEGRGPHLRCAPLILERPLEGHHIPGDVRGIAEWNHTIAYNRASVSEPLQQMYHYARHYNQDPKTLQSYREATKTVLHENVHMLAGEGKQHAQARHAFANEPGVKQAEEGFTELYSQQQLNAYIDDLGLEEIAPGIRDADAAVADKKYLPAAQNVADTIGRNSGLESARRSVDLKSLFGAVDRRERHCRRTWLRRLGRG